MTNRGDWLNEKWRVGKGYLKMHIAVDVKTGKIVSLKVKEGYIHNSKTFMDPVDGAGDMAWVARVLVDGAHDSTSSFSPLSEEVIEPAI